MSWEKAVSFEELQKKKRVLFHKESKQILILETPQGQIFALNNRCPHEGYPLKEGTLGEECVLTCQWHNWKFDLKTGNCILGGDHVQVYPVKIEDQSVWINLSGPSSEEISAKILGGFQTAFQKRQYGRMIRELARLHFQGRNPTSFFLPVFKWCYTRLEFGTTHAYAATADWLQLYQENTNHFENQLICLIESFDHLSFDTLRCLEYPYSTEARPFSNEALIQAIEQEKESDAIALMNGALDSGLHYSDLEPILAKIALLHYNDFGHSLIWVYKLGTLVRFLGTEIERWILPPLIRSFCFSTREDLTPEFKEYASFHQQLSETRPTHSTKSLIPAEEAYALTTHSCMAWVCEKSKQFSPESIYWAMLEASARNMLYFDLSFQQQNRKSVQANVDWLDFSHALTFANALRSLATKYPELWKQGLLQMACFQGRNRDFLDLEQETALWMVSDVDSFWKESLEQILDHGLGLPIYSAHWLKTFSAVREEFPHAPATCQKYLLAALNRFLHSPLKMKFSRRLVRQGIDLVGKDFASKKA
ncbi:MAG: Rieske (2Fe-2S) protein [Planctomycetota bacterium]